MRKVITLPHLRSRGGVRGGYLVLLGLAACVGVGFGQPYDPPQRIWLKWAPRFNGGGSQIQWFHDFTWIGDQFGDGRDELLICEEPWIQGENGPRDPANLVELYIGAEELAQEPDVLFEARDSLEGMGMQVTYLGQLTAQGARDFAILSVNYERNFGDDRNNWCVNIYEGGPGRFDTEADFQIRIRTEWGGVQLAKSDRPCDINGDGFDDLLVQVGNTFGLWEVRIYYGGAEFDTVPDLSLRNPDRGWFGSLDVLSGFDLNGDSCDEMLIQSQILRRGRFYDLYFGGAPMDTLPRFTFPVSGQYPGEQNLSLFYLNMFADINADGFDELGAGFSDIDPGWNEFQWVFFGGEEFDTIPDRSLQPGPVPSGYGNLYGGNANGDGYGDIVVHENSYGTGDVRIYFGAPWADDRYDVIVLAEQDGVLNSMKRTQGAYADFNGDGAGDFVISIYLSETRPRMAIYAGNTDWRLSAEGEGLPPLPRDLELAAYPNPFNSTLQARMNLPAAGLLSVVVRDISGRRVAGTNQISAPAGGYAWTWDAKNAPAGVYLISAMLHAAGGSVKKDIKVVKIN